MKFPKTLGTQFAVRLIIYVVLGKDEETTASHLKKHTIADTLTTDGDRRGHM